jgi:hypothetical protein
MPESYADLVARLAAAADQRAAAHAEADAWFATQCAAAQASVAQADERLAAAAAAREQARENVEFTDGEAARLWHVLARRMKVPAATLGPPPDEEAPGALREHPARLLDHARERLDEVKPARVRRTAARLLVALFLLALLAGVAAATLALRG